MAVFSYRAATPSGEIRTGAIEAPDRRRALELLRAQSLRALELRHGRAAEAETRDAKAGSQPDKAALAEAQLDKIGGGAASKLAVAFLSKLLQLHGSGMPLGDAVRLLTQRTSNPLLCALSARLWRDLSEGRSLAVAMAQQPRVFDAAVVHLVEAGETTGNLCPVLQNVIQSLEDAAALRKRIIGGLAYPAFICALAFGVVCLFVFFLLPRVQGMMTALGQKMSLSAKILIGFSDAFLHYGPFVLVALFILALSLQRWRKTEEGRRKSDEILLKIPVVRDIVWHTDLCRISNLIATLIESGVNTTEAMRMTEKAVHNTVLRERFGAARVMINDGAAFSLALRKHAVLPELDLDILAVGENTGSIVRAFREIHKNHTEDLGAQFKVLTAVISAGALLFAFGLVAMLALGIVSSVFQLSQSVLGGH